MTIYSARIVQLEHTLQLVGRHGGIQEHPTIGPKTYMRAEAGADVPGTYTVK